MKATLPRIPSKTDEITYYRAFVEGLPRASYLRSMLQDTPPMVEDLIRSDLVVPEPISTIAEHIRGEDERLQSLRQASRKATEQLARLNRQIERAEGQLADLRTTAEHIARQCRVC